MLFTKNYAACVAAILAASAAAQTTTTTTTSGTSTSTAAISSSSSSVPVTVTVPSSTVVAPSSTSTPVTTPVTIPTATSTAGTVTTSAPVTTVVTTSGTSTTTSDRSTSASSTVSAETSVATPFVITITISGNVRRQAVTNYVEPNGALTTDSTAAATFNLANGQLFSQGTLISTGPAIPATQVLQGSAAVGSISTVWSSTNGVVGWSNAAFANGAASFCLQNNIVYMVFIAAPPAGCVPVSLATAPVPAGTGLTPSVTVTAGAGTVTGSVTNNIINNVIGVIVTININLSAIPLGNGTYATSTGLLTSTCPLYATATAGTPCYPCELKSLGLVCPSSGVTVYTTVGAYATAAAAVVTAAGAAPIAVAAAAAAAAGEASVAVAAAAAAAGEASVAVAATAKAVVTGAATSNGVASFAAIAGIAAFLM